MNRPAPGRFPHAPLSVIVLAAGSGKRLQAFTEALYGAPLPKQFCAFEGERTLLQQTLDRVEALVPRSRIFVVVDRSQVLLAAEQLQDLPGVHLLDQPGDRGTAAGLLLPLTHVLLQDPEALVLVTPSDHGYARPEGFRSAVVRAAGAVAAEP